MAVTAKGTAVTCDPGFRSSILADEVRVCAAIVVANDGGRWRRRRVRIKHNDAGRRRWSLRTVREGTEMVADTVLLRHHGRWLRRFQVWEMRCRHGAAYATRQQ